MAEYSRIVSDPYREDFVCWASNPGEDYPYDHDHAGDCDWGWACNQAGCRWRADHAPCPDHAPTVFLGLRLVECQAEPRHWLWVHDREDYGHGCPLCWYEQAAAELAPLQMTAGQRAHRWCWLVNPLKRAAVWAHVARIRSFGDPWCRHVDVRWRWSR